MHFAIAFVDLIKQLYDDGYITAEQMSDLESNKLFESPVATTTAPSILPVVCECSMVHGNISSLGVSTTSTAEGDVSKLQNDHVEVKSAHDESAKSTLNATATEHNSISTDTAGSDNVVVRPDQTIDIKTYEHDIQVSTSITPSTALPTDSKVSPINDMQSYEASGISVASKEENCKDSFSESTHQSTMINTEKTDVQNVDKNLHQDSSPISDGISKEHKEDTVPLNNHDKSHSPALLEHKEGTLYGM